MTSWARCVMELTRRCSLAVLKNSSTTMKIVDTLLERGIYPSQGIVRDAPDRVRLSVTKGMAMPHSRDDSPECLNDMVKSSVEPFEKCLAGMTSAPKPMSVASTILLNTFGGYTNRR